MARTAPVRPADFTGLQKERLAAEQAEAVKARGAEMAMSAKAAAEADQETVDLSPRDMSVPEVTAVEVGLAEQMREFRVNTDLEMVTIGRDNHYDFEAGRTYRAPKFVYDHLEEKGYVWH